MKKINEKKLVLQVLADCNRDGTKENIAQAIEFTNVLFTRLMNGDHSFAQVVELLERHL